MRRLAFFATTLLAAAQEPAKLPSFEIADVHPSAKGQSFRTGGARGRYQAKGISMLNLIGEAYDGQNLLKILGGPSWIQMERYDITARVPPDTPVETQRLMMQSLLAERFGLKVHRETKGMQTHALVMGRKPLLKEADASSESACTPRTIPFSKPGEDPKLIFLGPGSTVTYTCRNMSMDRFVDIFRRFAYVDLGGYPIFNETGLKGNWNFDLTYSVRSASGMPGDDGERIPLTEAVEKQLGLKLEPREIPTEVLVVESVNRTPTPNPPGLAEALPPIVLPREFEVASIKPAAPVDGFRRPKSEMQPSGRYLCDWCLLRPMIDRAFDAANREAVQNVPAFAENDRYDITAKVTLPAGYRALDDSDLIGPLTRSLLVDRFKMTWHAENREVTAYDLVASKPKMKMADPATRANCTYPYIGPPGSPPGTMQITCVNATMAQFAEALGHVGQDIVWPVEDKTAIEGGWNLTVTYMRDQVIPTADPIGGYTIFQAIEKQLGLKLEKVKRVEPVIVIDHLLQKPAGN